MMDESKWKIPTTEEIQAMNKAEEDRRRAQLDRMVRNYYPRWRNRFYAFRHGFFWLPCPICNRPFGGHEWAEDAHLMSGWSGGEGVCPLCADEARRRNEAFMKANPHPPIVVHG